MVSLCCNSRSSKYFQNPVLYKVQKFTEDQELTITFEALNALLQQVRQESRRIVMTGDDLDGRAVFFALGSPVLVQRRPVGGAEVLADFKAQVIRISEMGRF